MSSLISTSDHRLCQCKLAMGGGTRGRGGGQPGGCPAPAGEAGAQEPAFSLLFVFNPKDYRNLPLRSGFFHAEGRTSMSRSKKQSEQGVGGRGTTGCGCLHTGALKDYLKMLIVITIF